MAEHRFAVAERLCKLVHGGWAAARGPAGRPARAGHLGRQHRRPRSAWAPEAHQATLRRPHNRRPEQRELSAPQPPAAEPHLRLDARRHRHRRHHRPRAQQAHDAGTCSGPIPRPCAEEDAYCGGYLKSHRQGVRSTRRTEQQQRAAVRVRRGADAAGERHDAAAALGGPPGRVRARDLGIAIGVAVPRGRATRITDVPGVLVGHCTVSWGDPSLPPGRGPARHRGHRRAWRTAVTCSTSGSRAGVFAANGVRRDRRQHAHPRVGPHRDADPAHQLAVRWASPTTPP